MAAIARKTDAPINFSQPVGTSPDVSQPVAEILERETVQQSGSSLAGRATFKPENISKRQKCKETQARIELVRTLLKADEPQIAEAEMHLNQIIDNYSYLNRTQKIEVILIIYAMSLYPNEKKWKFLSVSLSTTAAPSDQARNSWRKNFARKSL